MDLEAGRNYRIDVKGNERTDYGGTAPDTIMSLTMPAADSGTLLNPITNVVYHIAPGGTPSQAMIATGGGRGANARLDIAVLTSGEFLIEASDSNSTGTYTVTVKEIHFPTRGTRTTVSEASGSDLPSTGTTTGYIQVNGASATGSLQTSGDSDSFVIMLEARRSYRIDVWGDDTQDYGGTLADPYAVLTYENGQTITTVQDVKQTNLINNTQHQFGVTGTDLGSGKTNES